MNDAEKLKVLQANLESVVQQLEAKTKEAAAAVKDSKTNGELAAAMTKKLDTVSKRNKQLEKDNARFLAARDGMAAVEVQTDPDARLLEAQAQAAAAAAAEVEAHTAAKQEVAAAEKAAAEALDASRQAAATDLEAAKTALAAAEARAIAADESAAVAMAAAEEAKTAAASVEGKAKEDAANAAASFAAELAACRARLREAEEGGSAALTTLRDEAA